MSSLWSDRTRCVLSCFTRDRLLAIPRTVVHQAPPYVRFSRQEYWSGLPFPPPGDLPDPGIEPASLMSPALAGGFFTVVLPGTEPGGHPTRSFSNHFASRAWLVWWLSHQMVKSPWASS